MSAKNNIRNICISFFFTLLADAIYSGLGLLVLGYINIKILPSVIVVALLCGLLFVGYMVGTRLISEVRVRAVSVVIIPMILLLLTFGLGIIVLPVVSLLVQYPLIILSESLNINMLTEDNPITFYAMVIVYHLICCLSLLIGSYRKNHAGFKF